LFREKSPPLFRRRILGIFSVDCFAAGEITSVVESTGVEGLIVSFGLGRSEVAVGEE
jgi:hypothetical protein